MALLNFEIINQFGQRMPLKDSNGNVKKVKHGTKSLAVLVRIVTVSEIEKSQSLNSYSQSYRPPTEHLSFFYTVLFLKQPAQSFQTVSVHYCQSLYFYLLGFLFFFGKRFIGIPSILYIYKWIKKTRWLQIPKKIRTPYSFLE